MAIIVIEATGCDNGFPVVFEGARRTIKREREYDGIKDLKIILVAGRDRLPSEYLGRKSLEENLYLEVSETTYKGENWPKPDCSIRKAIKLYKDGYNDEPVDAVLAPGDTGATVKCVRNILGNLKGAKESFSIVTSWPNMNVSSDGGANPDPKIEDLFFSAIAGNLFAKICRGVESPLVGLVANGKEMYKGNKLTKAARECIYEKLNGVNGYSLLGPTEDDPEQYFFEGNFYMGWGRVGIMDGNSGNIHLKGCEAAIKYPSRRLIHYIRQKPRLLKILTMLLMEGPARKLKEELNYQKYAAAAPLLGANGIVMIGHGSSDASAIEDAIYVTRRYIRKDLNTKLEQELKSLGV